MLLVACADYAVNVNERAVYTPPSLFMNFRVADPALQQCLEQTVIDQQIRRPGDLTQLRCRHGGIRGLDGIDTFFALRRLDLGYNDLSDLAPLADLPSLTHLHLRGNAVTDVAPLYGLVNLESLVLTDNPALDCASAAQLAAKLEAGLVLPAHCAAAD